MMNAIKLVYFDPYSPYFPGVARLLAATWPTHFVDAAEAEGRIARHASFQGFKGVAALAEGTVVGLNYGYTNAAGQWWYQQIARMLGPHETKLHLDGMFAFTELAVAPEWRGCGVGRQLHDALLDGLPHARAVLSTQVANEAALRLYRLLGWRTLVPAMYFDGNVEPYTILERTLG